MNIQDATNIYVGSSAASKVMLGDTQVWPPLPIDWSTRYLTFFPKSSGNFVIFIPRDLSTTYLSDVSYSINGGSWVTITNTSTNTLEQIAVQSGDSIRIKGTSSAHAIFPGSGTGIFYPIGSRTPYDGGLNLLCTCPYDIAGNIMSVLYGDSFIGQTSIANWAFTGLFASWDRGTRAFTSAAVDAFNLVLPTTLKNNCFAHMFNTCTSLVNGPKLMATSLISDCYDHMFYDCQSLQTLTAAFTDNPSASKTDQWMYNVCANGTMYVSRSASWTSHVSDYYYSSSKTYGVPSSWTYTYFD